MMPKRLNLARGLQIFKAAPLVLLLLQGNTVFAQSTTSAPGNSITVGEILLYIALIVGVIMVAWFFGAGQSKSAGPHDIHHPRKHYDHPNDPHFRKLKKKTS
jgi:hypothetical protein